MTDWVAIPAGQALIALHPAADFPPHENETPRRIVSLAAFRLGRVPVTTEQYHGTGDDRPVTYVSLADAQAFCARRGVRLPTEHEWEAAARRTGDALWPWGDELPDRTRAFYAAGITGPHAVGRHPAGASPFGALDLAGNVAEWTSDGVVRGGSYLGDADDLRCSAGVRMNPGARDPYVGFRVVAVDPETPFDWVDVPAGDYPVGRDPEVHRSVHVDAFELARAPVTNAAYADFVSATGAEPPPHWPAPADHPVTFVDWFDAERYCAWAGGRLPDEVEWEAAASGGDGRRYPWGDTEDPLRAAIGIDLERGAPSPVGSHPAGASPYGLQDMAGNVWEWTATPWVDGERVLRGGSYASPGLPWARCAMRSHSRPLRRQAHVGFRIARGAVDGR